MALILNIGKLEPLVEAETIIDLVICVKRKINYYHSQLGRRTKALETPDRKPVVKMAKVLPPHTRS